ncbi:MAG: response regulator [Candidatus Sumerlaeia bacterium]|nr:response regulator [Candidatus Sumerlaeia bacterium]
MPRPLVALIDDDPDVRHLLAMTLKRLYRVETAPDGPAGLELVRAQRPNVVVTDLGMPGLNGLDLCGTIKSDPELARIPVIIITGATRGEELPGGFWRLGTQADDFLQKPFPPEQLLAAVQAQLERAAGYKPLPPGTGSYGE